jgi:aspartokinase-like uncharacterized kinase
MKGRWAQGVIQAAAIAPPCTIVKFGGSLLVRPHWAGEVRMLLATVPHAAALVVGGGPLVDGLRAIDAADPQPADRMDRLAIEAMGLTARMVAEATGLPIAIEPQGGRLVVLDASAWLARHRGSHPLPVGWGVTSDSIAAAVAAAHGASLVLAKSVAPPNGASLEELAQAGWVDEQFPLVAARVAEIRWAAPEAVTPRSSR